MDELHKLYTFQNELVWTSTLDSSVWRLHSTVTNRVGQSREIYSNSVPLLPPHWPYPKRIRPPSWPRVAVASSIQNTKLFTWRTWPGAGAEHSEMRLSGAEPVWIQTAARRSHKLHLICCDAWPIRYHYGTDDCMNMITRMTMHYFKCNRIENDNILLTYTFDLSGPQNSSWYSHLGLFEGFRHGTTRPPAGETAVLWHARSPSGLDSLLLEDPDPICCCWRQAL